MNTPIFYQRSEAFAGFVASIYFYHYLHFNFVWFVVLVLVFDAFAVGYIHNTKLGAQIYNIGHSLFLPIAGLVLGASLDQRWAIAGSLIWLAHICVDRMFGYGLKHSDSFHNTHLGKIGKAKKQEKLNVNSVQN